MTKKESLQLFEEKKVRTVWDDKEEKWYFSIVDVCGVLTDQPDTEHARNYWKVLKHRLVKEENQPVTNCNRLKLRASDGKLRMTDVADTEQLFRIIQSIPSPKAEPFKVWMAQVASTRLEQMQDPEKSIDQAIVDYKRLGYSDVWINQRIKSIEIRKELTDEWARTGVQQGLQYASLTDIITREWSGMTTKQYKSFKGLKKKSLRDNMTNMEIALNMLAEASATELSKQRNPNGFHQQKQVAKDSGSDEYIRKRYYSASVESVNIGAFPLLPNSDTLLREHLNDILMKYSTTDIHVAKAKPQRTLADVTEDEKAGMLSDNLVMVAIAGSEEKRQWTLDKLWYNIPLDKVADSPWNQAKNLLLYVKGEKFVGNLCKIVRTRHDVWTKGKLKNENYPDAPSHPAYFMIRIRKPSETDAELQKLQFKVKNIPNKYWGNERMAFMQVKLNNLENVLDRV